MKTFYISTGGYPWFNRSPEDKDKELWSGQYTEFHLLPKNTISSQAIKYLEYEILRLDNNNLPLRGNYITLNIPDNPKDTINYATTQLYSYSNEFAIGEINMNKRVIRDRVSAGVSLYTETHEYPGFKVEKYYEKDFGLKEAIKWSNRQNAYAETELLSITLKYVFEVKKVQRKLKELIGL